MKLFKHHVPHVVLLLALLDFALLLGAAEIGWVVRARQIGMTVTPAVDRSGALISFAVAMQIAIVSAGGYGADAIRSMRIVAARLIVAAPIGLALFALTYFAAPGATLWRSHVLLAIGVAYVLLLAGRVLFSRSMGDDALKRRVLVLGAGARANRISELAAKPGASFCIVGHIDMGEVARVVTSATPRTGIPSIAAHVSALGAAEVVLALEERRNAIPMNDLLRVRTAGIHVNEITTFLERETGRVDLRSANPSWLILSDGFSSGRALTGFTKRVFDILVSGILLILMLPVIAITAICIKLETAGPAFYRQTRVGLFGEHFSIVKLRSMRTDAESNGTAMWAQHRDERVTRTGRVIRALRIDELPQLWTVLTGQMSFVGPRPERPAFVAELEQQMPFYAERHMVKPGITGWAQINYPYGASTGDARHKLEYDLYYAKNYSAFLDLVVLLQTVRVILFPIGVR